MRVRFPVLAIFAVTAASLAACGGDQKEPENPTKVTTTKTPVEDPKPTPTTSATAPVDPPAPKLSMAEMQKKAILGITAAFNAHDAKKLAAFYTADASLRSPSPGGWKEEKGRDELEKSHAGLFASVPDVKVGTVRVLQKGDVAVWEWVGTGTDTVGMGGEKPTNKPVGFQAASVMWFDAEGLVKVDHTYYDAATIAGQLGKLPMKDMKVRPVATMPSGEGTWVESKGADAETKNVDTMKTFYGTLEKGDEKAFLGMVDDKVVHSDLAMPADASGKDGAKKDMANFKKMFSGVKFNNEQMWGIGDVVVVEGGFSAKHIGAMGPIKASNKQVTLHALDIVDMKDGKVLKATTYDNGGEMAAQVMPPPPPKKDAPKKDAPKDAPKKDGK